MYDYCDQHGIAYEKCGKIIIALDDSELPKLDELERRGRENGVPGLRRLAADGDRARSSRTRSASPRCSRPTRASSTSPRSPARSPPRSGRPARRSRPASTVRAPVALERHHDRAHVEGPIPARARSPAPACGPTVWRCASGEPDDLRIVPFRGSYLKLKPQARHLVRDADLPGARTRRCRSSASTRPRRSAATSGSARPHCWRRRARAYSLRTFDRADALSTLSWPGTWKVDREVLAHRHHRDGLRRPSQGVRRRLLALRPGAGAGPRRGRPGRHPRPGRRAATASCSTTSPSPRPRAPCTSATPPRPRRPPRWRSPG